MPGPALREDFNKLEVGSSVELTRLWTYSAADEEADYVATALMPVLASRMFSVCSVLALLCASMLGSELYRSGGRWNVFASLILPVLLCASGSALSGRHYRGLRLRLRTLEACICATVLLLVGFINVGFSAALLRRFFDAPPSLNGRYSMLPAEQLMCAMFAFVSCGAFLPLQPPAFGALAVGVFALTVPLLVLAAPALLEHTTVELDVFALSLLTAYGGRSIVAQCHRDRYHYACEVHAALDKFEANDGLRQQLEAQDKRTHEELLVAQTAKTARSRLIRMVRSTATLPCARGDAHARRAPPLRSPVASAPRHPAHTVTLSTRHPVTRDVTAQVMHDIRSPLLSVANLAASLEAMDASTRLCDGAVREQLVGMRTCSMMMQDIVSDMLGARRAAPSRAAARHRARRRAPPVFARGAARRCAGSLPSLARSHCARSHAPRARAHAVPVRRRRLGFGLGGCGGCGGCACGMRALRSAAARRLLDFERIDSGRLELVVRPFELRQLAADSRATFEGLARERGVALVIQEAARGALGGSGGGGGGGGGARLLLGDRRRLQQCVNNGLSNAIKFTDAGGTVTMRIDLEPLAPAAADGAAEAAATAMAKAGAETADAAAEGEAASDADAGAAAGEADAVDAGAVLATGPATADVAAAHRTAAAGKAAAAAEGRAAAAAAAERARVTITIVDTGIGCDPSELALLNSPASLFQQVRTRARAPPPPLLNRGALCSRRTAPRGRARRTHATRSSQVAHDLTDLT
jgi:signal transduction histidine kinase